MLETSQPHLTVAATYRDAINGALYVHEDLKPAISPWSDEAHISPIKEYRHLGDIESFATYIAQYGETSSTLITWNLHKIEAVLDYHNTGAEDGVITPGRGQWVVDVPFNSSRELQRWVSLNGKSIAQRQAVEILEDFAGDIDEPKPVELTAILRSLRATVNSKADSELRPDGTSKVVFERDTKVASGSLALDLPSSFFIVIPVLKGHFEDGKPVVYRIEIKLRVSVMEDAKLALRFSIPNIDTILENVVISRVETAKELLDSFEILRGAD